MFCRHLLQYFASNCHHVVYTSEKLTTPALTAEVVRDMYYQNKGRISVTWLEILI
jgi:hypothetical protein